MTRTNKQYVKFAIEDTTGVMRDIPVSSINGIGLTLDTVNASIIMDSIRSSMTGQGTFSAGFSGPFDSASLVPASGPGEHANPSGSFDVLAPLDGGTTPKSFGIYFGIGADWTTGDPVFGAVSSILVTEFTVDSREETYTARIVTAKDCTDNPDWGATLITGAADIYYVSNAGDDGNGGHTIYDPLETIGAVNALSLTSSQQVLFKCGDTFAGQLAPTYRGSAVNWVTYGWYGIGAMPVIDGSAVNSAFYINDDQSYIRFEHLDFSGANGVSYSTIYCYSAHHLYFYDCIARDAANRHGASINGGAHVSHDITADTCQFYDNHMSGVLCSTLTSYNMLFTHCVSHDNGTSTSGDHGFYIAGGTITEWCTSYNNAAGGFKQNDNEVEPFYYPITRYCVSYGNNYGIIVTHKNSLFHDNLIYSNVFNAEIYGSAWGNCKLYFNTFVNGTSAVTRAIAFYLGVSPSLEIKNNLFIQDAAVVAKGNLHFDVGLGIADYAFAFDYNTYYFDGNAASHIIYSADDVGSELKDWTEWQAAGAEAHGTYLAGLPAFATRYTDLRPVDEGNLKALGVAITGYETDFGGYTRADPPTPGCYDTGVPNPPPSHISETIDLETNDWTQFTSTVIHDGLMTVDAAAALNGTTKGMKIVIDATDAVSYGRKTGMAGEYGMARVRFYFDPNTLTMAQDEYFYIASISNSSGAEAANMFLKKHDASYRIGANLYNDAGGSHSIASVVITDAPHYIEVYLRRAYGSATNDGSLLLQIDGVDKGTATGDNYDRFSVFDKLYIGALYGIDAGTTGTFYIDEIVINDTGEEIGA